MEWVSGHEKIYPSLFRSEAEALYIKRGLIHINREQTGAAMWLPAGVSAKPPFHRRLLVAAWKLWRTGGNRSLERIRLLDSLMAKHHPAEPHFYLHAIGARLGNQGRGIGSTLMKAGLEVCDQQGMPAYLESSNEKNNPLYQRFGFEVVEEMKLPDGGPSLWLMWRSAQAIVLT